MARNVANTIEDAWTEAGRLSFPRPSEREMSATSPNPDSVFRVFIPGKPEPQGLTKAFNIPGKRFPVVTSDNPVLKQWRALAVMTLQRAIPAGPVPVFSRGEAVEIGVEFVFPRLGAHPKGAGKREPSMLVKPDGDKLLRAVGDALTTSGIVADDSQIDRASFRKRYAAIGEAPGTHIAVRASI